MVGIQQEYNYANMCGNHEFCYITTGIWDSKLFKVTKYACKGMGFELHVWLFGMLEITMYRDVHL